jgi:hypothetical protein
MTYKDTIPKKFWHASEPSPVAYTVEDLIEILQELPPELPLTAGFGEAAMVVLYNIDREGMHVEVVECDEDEEDWEEDEE